MQNTDNRGLGAWQGAAILTSLSAVLLARVHTCHITLSLSLSHTYTHTHTLTPSHPLSHTHTHTHSLTHPPTHTHPHTPTYTHTYWSASLLNALCCRLLPLFFLQSNACTVGPPVFCTSCPKGKTSVSGSVSQMDCETCLDCNLDNLGAPSSNHTIVEGFTPPLWLHTL